MVRVGQNCFISCIILAERKIGIRRNMKEKLILNPRRFFDTDIKVRDIAVELYESVKDSPIISPHGHIEPQIFVDENYTFKNPTELIITPNHYLYRMLYSQGVPLEALGIPILHNSSKIKVEMNPKKIWQTFAEYFYLFRGTPSEIWLNYELAEIFGVKYKLTKETAIEIYEVIDRKLKTDEFKPRRLYERFKIKLLATTDDATSTLQHHVAIRNSGWHGKIIPTFRADSLINIESKGWKENIYKLSEVTKMDIRSYSQFIEAIRERRSYFKSLGATATDIAVLIPYTEELSKPEAEKLFSKALKGKISERETIRFKANMLMEMARLSIEDGLVMQLHCGSYRNHNEIIYKKFGPDRGCDIPIQMEFTKNLKALLNKYGNDKRLTLIVFTLDESTYSRELAPLAGHYPALKIGSPWWFHDSINGMMRFKEQIIETAGLYNTTGFVDDARTLTSIPARHDLARRIDANWLARLVSKHIISKNTAREMIKDLTYKLPIEAYKLHKILS
jgi:glucuronate isomerase